MKGCHEMNFKDLIKTSKIKRLPFEPINLEKSDIGGGVYRMYDIKGKVVYVGKSQDLHRRLHQHIGKDTNTAYFIDEVDYFEWLPEPDPIFQNMLEAIFIAYHQPKYNDEVKDKRRAEND
jgi:excinuclease UvrABC nuclease subunit